MIKQNITELIGKTPLVDLKKYEEYVGAKANIIAKLEYLNPAGSIKDRVAVVRIYLAPFCSIYSLDAKEFRCSYFNNCIVVLSRSVFYFYIAMFLIIDNDFGTQNTVCALK